MKQKRVDKQLIRIISTLLVLFAMTGCAALKFPGVHRITIQQGNVVTQQMIDRLRPGMTQSQVEFVLGNAVIDDQLNQDQWDYIYTVQLPNSKIIRKVLSVHFVNARLSHFSGDFIPTPEYEALEKTDKQD